MRGNRRALPQPEWAHRAVRRWRRLAAGASMRLRVPVGGYVLIGEGRVRVAAPAGERRVEGPGRAAVGGGAVRVTAETDATVAVGTVRTRPAVTIDGDGGYASALWELLGGNRRGDDERGGGERGGE